MDEPNWGRRHADRRPVDADEGASGRSPSPPGSRRRRFMTALFPAFLKLERRDVLLVGGGKVASAKLPELLRAGARVRVVAPHVHDSVMALDGVIVVQRAF